MGTVWLRDLPAALGGLGNVTWYDGWQTRARSSGGYTRLMGIVVHHTASTASQYSDTKYMWVNATTRPVGAIYLARDGTIVVGAAGATNCAGRGGPFATSKGVIALDTANSNTISIEAANAGTGEPWPKIQQDRYVSLVARLCKYYGLDPKRDALSHAEWTPGRKIDPAGQSRYASGRATWNMDLFRSDVAAALVPPTSPGTPSPEEEDDMLFICKVGADTFTGDGVRANLVPSSAMATLEANIEGNQTARWHHPARSGLPVITKMSDIPAINATQRDLLVGKVT